MRITALVENKSDCELKPSHGLSLYIETSNHKILFDLGHNNTLFENSKKRNIDLTEIDTVILSHGHMDHGGALEKFLKINTTAKIYVQRRAFENHYSKIFFFKVNVGLSPKLMRNSQIVLVDGNYQIDDELLLFTVKDISKCYSEVNDALYTDKGKDDFSHEQNLIILGKANVLITGCGHAGIINILEEAANYKPQVCVGGYHLFDPLTRKTVSYKLLKQIADELVKYNVEFYTYHCTGQTAFRYFAERLHNISYLSCGKSIDV